MKVSGTKKIQNHWTKARQLDEHNQWTTDTGEQCGLLRIIKWWENCIAQLNCAMFTQNYTSNHCFQSSQPAILVRSELRMTKAHASSEWQWNASNTPTLLLNGDIDGMTRGTGIRPNEVCGLAWPTRSLNPRTGLSRGSRQHHFMDNGAEWRYVNARITIACDIHAWISPKTL